MKRMARKGTSAWGVYISCLSKSRPVGHGTPAGIKWMSEDTAVEAGVVLSPRYVGDDCRANPRTGRAIELPPHPNWMVWTKRSQAPQSLEVPISTRATTAVHGEVPDWGPADRAASNR